MTTPKKLSELDPREVLRGHVVRLRDGEGPHAIRGDDLAAWAKLIEGKRDGDRFYLVPRIEFAPFAPLIVPMEKILREHDNLFEMRCHIAPQIAMASIRRLRDDHLIELDTDRRDAEGMKPIDDPADRFALLEIEEPEGA